MTADQFLWVLSRVAGLAAYAALSISVLSGVALRTAVLDWVASNRALRGVHEYTAVLWIPLGLVHLLTLLLDRTARVGVLDLVVPFRISYAGSYGSVAVGLGTIAFDLLIVVAITGWLKKHMSNGLWQWIHRLSYPAFALLFLHALLSGSDFSDPVVSALTWSVAVMLAVLTVARAAFGRLPAR